MIKLGSRKLHICPVTNSKVGSITGHRIDYNGVGALSSCPSTPGSTCKQKKTSDYISPSDIRRSPKKLRTANSIYHEVLKLNLKTLNAKGILLSSFIACFEALFLYAPSDISPSVYTHNGTAYPSQ